MYFRPLNRTTYRARLRLLGAQRDVSLRTRWEPQAQRREAMLLALDGSDLGRDVLRALLDNAVNTEQVAEAHRKGDAGLRALLQDAKAKATGDLDDLLEKWLLTVSPGTRAQHRRQVTLWLETYPKLSDLTPGKLTPWLESMDRSDNTRWHYGVSLKTFTNWLTRQGVLPAIEFQVPRKPGSRIRWHDLDAVTRILGATPQEHQCAFALLYGAGIELGVLHALRKRDVDVERRSVRAAGTKTWSRDRMARVEAWAWPYVLAGCAGRLPDALLVEASAKVLRRAHHAAQAACHLPGLTLHDARHSWAVRMLRDGVPLEAVSRQLGHRDGTMVLKVYGRFQVNAADWERWEHRALAQKERTA